MLQRSDPAELSRVLGARGPLLERALSSARALDGDPPLLAAWRRYQGVVWTHLEPATLPSALRRRVLVPSGLYGLVAAEDPIADYRLAMNVALAPLPSLAQYWRPSVTQLLDVHAGRSTIVSLLPSEHAASIDFAALGERRRVVHVRFVTADERRAVGHDAKAVKGVVARRLLTEGLEATGGMSWRGWVVRREESELVVRAP